MSKTVNISIAVHDNLERALKQLKKKIEREGVVRDMKRIVYYEPPTQKRRKSCFVLLSKIGYGWPLKTSSKR